MTYPMQRYKVFNDPIHGTILLHPLLVKIIDTPEFQRLRNIKQLGGGYFVYPGAQHNRFEHSIGTAHLAGKVARHLKKNQKPDAPDGITDKDVLCVEIAGLCHDLGHGPFSHVFERITEVWKVEWTHEKQSCNIFSRLMDRIEQDEDYKKLNEEYKLEPDDKKFIEELIDGPQEKYRGRPKKIYLYDIISNKNSGVDVDKWDYFARDCHHLGIANGFDHNRFIKFMRVVKDELCFRDKESFNLYQMFHTRFTIHKRAALHPLKNAYELMICDAICEANEKVEIPNDDGTKVKMSECLQDKTLGAFLRLDDRVLQTIEQLGDGNPGSGIVKRIMNRDHYKCVADKPLYRAQNLTEADIREQIANEDPDLPRNEIAISIVKFSYGKEDKNPVDFCSFYTKENPDEAMKIGREEVSRMLPDTFQELRVQVFSKKNENKGKVKEAFKMWYAKVEPPILTSICGLRKAVETVREQVASSTANCGIQKAMKTIEEQVEILERIATTEEAKHNSAS